MGAAGQVRTIHPRFNSSVTAWLCPSLYGLRDTFFPALVSHGRCIYLVNTDMPRLRPLPVDREKIRQLWGGCHAIIRNGGGVVVSVPDANPVRFEVPAGSDLPDDLRRCGFNVVNVGTTEKFMPVPELVPMRGTTQKATRDQMEMTTVDIFSFDLLTRSE